MLKPLSSITDTYIGRFAPSPSGPLHLGSLYTALASYLIAKSQQGQWLIRIEDIDPPREVEGASQEILSSLAAHGLIPSQAANFQSHNYHEYDRAIHRLCAANCLYRCNCNRKRLSEFNGYYDRHCLQSPPCHDTPSAIRFKAPSQLPKFSDLIQGPQSADRHEKLENDFIIKRKDGLWAYQLAMVVDDIQSGISEVVRGIDLLDNTAKQLALYQAFNATPPSYIHIPVLCTSPGFKLSKQNHAQAIANAQATNNLISCLKLLGQPLPDNASSLRAEQLIQFAVTHFQTHNIPRCQELII